MPGFDREAAKDRICGVEGEGLRDGGSDVGGVENRECGVSWNSLRSCGGRLDGYSARVCRSEASKWVCERVVGGSPEPDCVGGWAGQALRALCRRSRGRR